MGRQRQVPTFVRQPRADIHLDRANTSTRCSPVFIAEAAQATIEVPQLAAWLVEMP
jgi:hypothetical protein